MAEETQMMKGILEGCILALLKKEASYGYLVVEKLKKLGFEDISEATVYPILTRLEKKGELYFEKRASAIGPPRKYYGLTARGEKLLSGFIESWENTRRAVCNVLEEAGK